MRKKTFLLALGASTVMLCLAGCGLSGGTTSETKTASDDMTVSASSNETREPLEGTKNATEEGTEGTSVPLKIGAEGYYAEPATFKVLSGRETMTVKPNEEFLLKPGDLAKVLGEEEYYLVLSCADSPKQSDPFVEVLTIANKHQRWNSVRFCDNGEVEPLRVEFTPYQINMLSFDENGVVLKLDEKFNYPEPITLSGNPEDVTIPSDYTYVETDRYIVFIDKDFYIKGDLLTTLDEAIDRIEGAMGYSLISGQCYVPEYEVELEHPEKSYFGGFPWGDLNYEKEKMRFLLLADRGEMYISNADYNGVVFVDADIYQLESKEIDLYALTHELAHTVQINNSGHWNSIMSEGIGVYYAQRACEDIPNADKTYMMFECSQGQIDEQLNGLVNIWQK